MDLEGFARRRVLKGLGEEAILKELSEALGEFKDWEGGRRREFSEAVLGEVKAALGGGRVEDPILRGLLRCPEAGVKMGEFGVGSRGEGDFYVHRKIAEIIGDTGALVDAGEQDDAGVVAGNGRYITLAVDGMHSRLSEFPFLAGFHAARATLRDVCVMGSRPVAMLSDLHLADDGDVGKLFDFTAGVAAVGELTSVPLVSGSTLRIGGDMVLGERLVAAVGAVGVSDSLPKARRDAEAGDIILLTEGSGGGTITTIAIYNAWYEVVRRTLNVDFMRACKAMADDGLLDRLHAMADVTNGGLRGDAEEISSTAGKRLVFQAESLEKAVDPLVLEMLRALGIDPLGISTDSLMLILPEGDANEVKGALEKVTGVHEVGYVEEGRGARIIEGGKERDFKPLFREAPYTRVKKVVGEAAPEAAERMREGINRAAEGALEKKRDILKYIKEDRV